MKHNFVVATVLALCGASAFAAYDGDREAALALQGGRGMSLREAVMATHSFGVQNPAARHAIPADIEEMPHAIRHIPAERQSASANRPSN